MRLVASSGVWPSFQPVYDTPLRKMGFFPHPARRHTERLVVWCWSDESDGLYRRTSTLYSRRAAGELCPRTARSAGQPDGCFKVRVETRESLKGNIENLSLANGVHPL